MALHTPILPADRPCRTGELIRLFDWASTPLGPAEEWPERLRFALDICLRTTTPAAIYWGPQLTILYNDAFAEMLGERHPGELGRPAREVWRHSWDSLGPQFAAVIESGEGMSVAEQMVPVTRGGVVEETYWSYSLAPLVDEAGRVAGILGHRQDVTRAVSAERRLSFQVGIADAMRGATDPEEIKHNATRLLGEYLGAARVGYAEVDEAEGTAWVRSDWTRDPGVPSLSGQRAAFAAFGEEALRFLRTGEVLALPDIRVFPMAPEQAAAWEELGMRALITVPLVRDGELRAMLYVHEPQARQWRRSEAAMARDVGERTWAAIERAQAEQSLRESEDHYRHTVELNPQVTWTALPDGQLNRVSRRWKEWTGATGLDWRWVEGFHPDDREPSMRAWTQSVATGEPYDVEHRVIMRDGSHRWARSRAFPRYGSDGAICLWYGSTEDIHERKVAEEHQRLLLNELNHRVKNTLASVQAIAFQTLKGDIPLAEARARFEARLMALSRAHNLLTEQNWERASLERVIRDATEHLSGDADRFRIEGPEFWLAPRAALGLALALHELGTNAAKYGALCGENGTIAIVWREEEGRLLLRWTESGGPAVAAPSRRGFGSRLLEQGLESDLGGVARIDFDPAGLRCAIEASLETIGARETELG
jgi:PAS domain S-box-containing protein